MCLLGIAFQTLPGRPLLVLANREEAYARPATGPQIHPAQGENPAWLGGIDLQAGGTWLGVNAHGLLAAVTNRRRGVVPLEPRSRGRLCRSLLEFRSVTDASQAAVELLRQERFAGCNLLIATREAAAVIEFGDELRVTPLSPGLHLITNAALNDAADARIARVRKELLRAAPTDPTAWGREAQRICMLRQDADGPDIWLEGAGRGTVSSSVITMADRPADAHFWHALPPPSPFGYIDHAALLLELMNGSTAAIRRHRVHLRGPWRFEPLARAQHQADGQARWSHDDLPPPGTAQLPAPWSEFLPAFRGRVAFRRRFHRPSNLEPHERVDLVMEGINGAGQISLNGHFLGRIDNITPTLRRDITPLLAGNDELLVELELAPRANDTGTNATGTTETDSPPWIVAALEIRSLERGASSAS